MAKFAKKARKGHSKRRTFKKAKRTFKRKSFKKTRHTNVNFATISEVTQQMQINSMQGYTVMPNINDTVRAQDLMPSFQEYRIKSVTVKLVPRYDMYPNGTSGTLATANDAVPELYWASLATPQVPKTINIDFMGEMNAHAVKFDRTMARKVGLRVPAFQPNSISSGSSIQPANIGGINAYNFRLGKSSPWLPTSWTAGTVGELASSVSNQAHFGAVFYINQPGKPADAPGPNVGYIETSWVIQFRKPITLNVLPAGLPVTVDVISGLPLS